MSHHRACCCGGGEPPGEPGTCGHCGSCCFSDKSTVRVQWTLPDADPAWDPWAQTLWAAIKEGDFLTRYYGPQLIPGGGSDTMFGWELGFTDPGAWGVGAYHACASPEWWSMEAHHYTDIGGDPYIGRINASSSWGLYFGSLGSAGAACCGATGTMTVHVWLEGPASRPWEWIETDVMLSVTLTVDNNWCCHNQAIEDAAAWDIAETYAAGAYVRTGTDPVRYWVSLADDNQGNEPGDLSEYWDEVYICTVTEADVCPGDGQCEENPLP